MSGYKTHPSVRRETFRCGHQDKNTKMTLFVCLFRLQVNGESVFFTLSTKMIPSGGGSACLSCEHTKTYISEDPCGK